MSISGIGAIPEPQGNTNANATKSKDVINVSIFAKQDVNTNGEITGDELMERERFINDILFDFISEKINQLATLVKNYTMKYDPTNEQSIKKAEEQTETFIANINQQITNIKLEEFKKENRELEDDGETGTSTMFTNYYDIDGNYHTYEYDQNGTLINSKVQTPEEMKNMYNTMKAQYISSTSTIDNEPVVKENGNFEEDIQNLISKFEGAKYRQHASQEGVGQMKYKEEFIVIMKNDNNTYRVIRQHSTQQNNIEQKEYGNLNEIYEDMSREDYGWGRNSYRPDGPPFTMRDVLFMRTK